MFIALDSISSPEGKKMRQRKKQLKIWKKLLSTMTIILYTTDILTRKVLEACNHRLKECFSMEACCTCSFLACSQGTRENSCQN